MTLATEFAVLFWLAYLSPQAHGFCGFSATCRLCAEMRATNAVRQRKGNRTYTMKSPRAAWYVAGLSDELEHGELLAQAFLEGPVVLSRRPDGGATALQDRCPHRFASLSAGTLVGDSRVLQCMYHGLQFDQNGVCVHNPHRTGAMPKAASVRAHEGIERHGLLWWWAADAGTADGSLMPDYSRIAEAPPDASIRGYLPSDCDYVWHVDYIHDLTHVDDEHSGILGTGSIARSEAPAEDLADRSVRNTWLSSGDRAAPGFDKHLRLLGQPTDQWAQVSWTAPVAMILQIAASLQGEAREYGVDTLNQHHATPESPGRTHHWYWATRNFAVHPVANAAIVKMLEFAFEKQDKSQLEAQQINISTADLWELKPVLLRGDFGAQRVRRKLEDQLNRASRPFARNLPVSLATRREAFLLS